MDKNLEYLRIVQKNTKCITSPYKRSGVYESKDYLFIESAYTIINSSKTKELIASKTERLYFTNTFTFSTEYITTSSEWKFTGLNFGRLIQHGNLSDYNIEDIELKYTIIKKLFSFWNKHRPLWKIPVPKKTSKLYQIRQYIMMFRRFYDNPALALVYKELGPGMVIALGLYTFSITQYGEARYSAPIKYTKVFNYNATNVRDFIGCSRNIYKWIKRIGITVQHLTHLKYISELADWKVARYVYGETKRRSLLPYLYFTDFYGPYTKELLMEVFSFCKEMESRKLDNTTVKYFLTLYKDTINMSNRLDIPLDFKLRFNTTDALTNIHYNLTNLYNEHLENQNNPEVLNSKIKKIYEDNKDKELIIDGYNFQIPKSVQEFIIESNTLNHCVSSYVHNYINGETFIVFQRNSKGSPLLTIELSTNKKEVRQHRGKGNRDPKPEEAAALNTYMKLINN